MENKQKALSDKELESVSGGPEERTVLGLASAADAPKCKKCGRIIESDAFTVCPSCGNLN